MRPHILFVDTETTGIPQNWEADVSDVDKWPSIIQLAWVVCDNKGSIVKRGNHYVKSPDIVIEEASIPIHGITMNFLQKNGIPRKDVMRRFYNDLIEFNPLVVGHFVKLDISMIGVGFNRAGIENIILNYPHYCTMLGSEQHNHFPNKQYPKLNELYKVLFKEELKNHHNALIDAQATADCFFELLRRNEISEEKIEVQIKDQQKKSLKGLFSGCIMKIAFLPFLLVILYLAIS